MHALILGDHRLLADLLKRDLVAIGFESVLVASDEDEALNLGRQVRPDLILVDDHNSIGLGLGMVEELSGLEPIPVVYVTGNSIGIQRRLPSAVTVSTFGAASLRSAIFKASKHAPADRSNVTNISSYR